MEPTTALFLASTAANLGGSIWGASSASSSQNAANKANAALAARQSQDALNNWLVSRGINPGIAAISDTSTFLANNPQYMAEWNRVRASGDRRSFDEWLKEHLALNPIEASRLGAAGGSNAVNTTLPLWATTGGMPTEQFLLNSILRRSGMAVDNPSDPGYYASLDQIKSFLEANPNVRAEIESQPGWENEPRSIEQWLRDHVTQTEGGAGRFSGYLKDYAAQTTKADADAAAAARAVPSEYTDLQKRALESAGRIFDGGYLSDELNALAPALAARRRAADLGLDRNNEMRSRVGDIYSAELLAADTYGNSAMDAVSRVLAENKAKRALQGFSGGSSFDDLTRARTLAPALNAGAMARATAGVNKAKSLSGILDTDVQISQQNADLQNAIDRLQLISGDINRKIGSSSLPAQLYSNKVQMDSLASDASFRDIDATLKRLGLFTSNNSTPPTPTYAQAQPSITGGQIAGQALSTLGQMGMNYWSTQSLLNGLKNTGGSTYKGIPVANTPDTASTGKWW